jgi:hypothetical protein
MLCVTYRYVDAFRIYDWWPVTHIGRARRSLA